MAKLREDHKVLIVQRLATFTTPTEIQAELKELGVVVELAQVVYYSPDTKHTDLAPKWRKMFDDTRAAFKKDTANIAIAHKSFRLQELQRMYRKLMSGTRPNMPLAKELLEQAAKEVGEAYTNRRQLVSPNPLEDLAKLLDLTPEQLTQAIATEGLTG